EESGSAELHEDRAVSERSLVRVRGRDVAVTSGQHDRLVIAAHLAPAVELERAEISREVGSPELVVERGAADGPVDHDREGRRDARGPSVIALPWLARTGDLEVRHRESREARLRLRADAGRALVANLASRAR